MAKEKGIVFNIQRFTVHDGPGIRTEIFLKGCPLHCKWCSNPESIYAKCQLGIYPDKCIGKDICGSCIQACPRQGKPLEFSKEGMILGSNEQCLSCLSCAKACFLHAIKAWGQVMTVDEVMDLIRQDEIYYRESNGGVTLNGGEVTIQWEFAAEILKACRTEGYHTCVETSMYCKTKILDLLYPLCDLMITDIKHMDTEEHARWCGRGNEEILANIRHSVLQGQKLVIRIPVIPHVNDSKENIRATALFIKEELHNQVLQVQLLPYKKLGTDKYASLGLAYPMGEDYHMQERSVWEENIRSLRDLMLSYGVPAVAGSNEKLPI